MEVEEGIPFLSVARSNPDDEPLEEEVEVPSSFVLESNLTTSSAASMWTSNDNSSLSNSVHCPITGKRSRKSMLTLNRRRQGPNSAILYEGEGGLRRSPVDNKSRVDSLELEEGEDEELVVVALAGEGVGEVTRAVNNAEGRETSYRLIERSENGNTISLPLEAAGATKGGFGASGWVEARQGLILTFNSQTVLRSGTWKPEYQVKQLMVWKKDGN